MSIPRAEILKRLWAQVEAGKPIIGCGAGTGISAKFAEAGGARLVGGSAALRRRKRHRR